MHLTLGQASHFQDALKAFVAQTHTVFIAEGVPLYPSLGPDRVPDLTGDMPLGMAVQ